MVRYIYRGNHGLPDDGEGAPHSRQKGAHVHLPEVISPVHELLVVLVAQNIPATLARTPPHTTVHSDERTACGSNGIDGSSSSRGRGLGAVETSRCGSDVSQTIR